MQHLQSAKDSLHSLHDATHADCHTRVQLHNLSERFVPVSPKDVLRYRYHHGVNLGACFVLEKWLAPSMFPQGADTSEHAAVQASTEQIGLDATRKKWEAHWAGMVSEHDIDWLVSVARCTSVRLPIGYWVFGTANAEGTPFEEFAGVYVNAWTAVKKLVARLRARGIGTLIDLHGLPGGANGGDHSGTNTGRCELWTKPANLDRATDCLLRLAKETVNMDGVIGLQLCNEAMWKAPRMYDWYNRVLSEIALIDPTLPIYTSDAWNLKEAVNWVQAKNTVRHASNPVIIDTHYYWTFSESDKLKSPQMITAEVPSKLSELNGAQGNVVQRGTVETIVGEYSCTMSDETWSLSPPHLRPSLTLAFGQAQSRQWQTRAAGAYFWTFKMDWMDGGDWGFVAQTKTRAITPPAHLTLSCAEVRGKIGAAQGHRSSKRTASVAGHTAYWANAAPNKALEHWRFEVGWDLGFSDALAFFGMRCGGGMAMTKGGAPVVGGVGGSGWDGGDSIGCLEIWVRKRILEGDMSGESVWEFEAGFRQGVKAFEEVIAMAS